MTASTRTLPGVQIIGVRYRGARPAVRDERSLDRYQSSGIYAAGGEYAYVEPQFPEPELRDEMTDNLGLINGEIADAVAAARGAGKAVMMVGGDCQHITGVVGGLQDAHGPTAKIGLIWFDAHGDFNTPGTTLSGMLGGMPVAVAAGLAFPRWRELSHIQAPVPTDRIVMVDVRNLDPAEAQLVNATDIVVAAPAAGFPGADLEATINDLAERCDYLYLHIDSDILDASYVPNHGTKEPNGPNMGQVHAAIDTVMATGKVVAFAVVSVYGEGEGHEVTQASGVELIRGGLEAWNKHGMDQVNASS